MKEWNDIKWHFWHLRKRTPLYLYFCYYGPIVCTRPEFPFVIETNGSCVDHILTSEEELKKYRFELWQKYQEDPTFLYNLMQEAYNRNAQDIRRWRAWKQIDYSQLNNSELLAIYQRYVDEILQYGPYVYIPLAVEPNLTGEVQRLVQGEEYNIVMTPVHESDLLEEKKSLLQMAISWNFTHMPEHVEKYSFLKQKGMFMEFFDEQYYREEIKLCHNPQFELQQLQKETARKVSLFQLLLKKFPQAEMLFKTVNEAVYFRTWRTDHMAQSSYYVIELFQEIAKRVYLPAYKDVLYLVPQEVAQLLQNQLKADLATILQRKDAFVYMTFGQDNQVILEGAAARQALADLHLQKQNTEKISGTPAFPGRVKGRVVVVQDHHDYSKIKSADILVTHATLPEMVPYFGKIKAIVTEEGGILSHAAIISREMKIPCVMGTGNATKVLKDGDLVEIDAEKGLVRKI